MLMDPVTARLLDSIDAAYERGKITRAEWREEMAELHSRVLAAPSVEGGRQQREATGRLVIYSCASERVVSEQSQGEYMYSER